MLLCYLYFFFMFIFVILYFFFNVLLILLALEFFMLFMFFFLFLMGLSGSISYMVLMLAGCFFVLEAIIGLIFFLLSFRFYGSSHYFLW